MFKKLRNITLFSLVLITVYSKTFALSLQTDLIDSNGQVNIQYSCKGGDQIPPIQWQDVPANRKIDMTHTSILNYNRYITYT